MSTGGAKRNKKSVEPPKSSSFFGNLFNLFSKALQAIKNAFSGLAQKLFGTKQSTETAPQKTETPPTPVQQQNKPDESPGESQNQPSTSSSNALGGSGEKIAQEQRERDTIIQKHENMIAEIRTLLKNTNMSDELKKKLQSNIQAIGIHITRLKTYRLGYKPKPDQFADQLSINEIENSFKPYLDRVKNNIKEAHQQMKATPAAKEEPPPPAYEAPPDEAPPPAYESPSVLSENEQGTQDMVNEILRRVQERQSPAYVLMQIRKNIQEQCALIEEAHLLAQRGSELRPEDQTYLIQLRQALTNLENLDPNKLPHCIDVLSNAVKNMRNALPAPDQDPKP